MTTTAQMTHDPLHDAFFSKLWEMEAYQKVFFAHRRTLFPSIDSEGSFHAPLPMLYAGSLPAPRSIHVLEAFKEVNEVTRDGLLRGLEHKLDNLATDVKVLAIFLILRFITKNPDLRSLLESCTPSWPEVAKVVASTNIDLDIFGEFSRDDSLDNATSASDGTTVLPQRDHVLGGKIAFYTDELRGFLGSGNASKLLDFADRNSLHDVYQKLCREHCVKLLQRRNIDPKEYTIVLADLYLKKLIDNTSTLFWCKSCHDDPCVITSRARLSPQQSRLKCPKCDKKMLWATVYNTHQVIRDSCFAKDGCLGIATRWLLQKRQIKFQEGSYTNRDFELDFRFTIGERRILLECKMHKTYKDTETIERNVSGAVKQAARHAEAILQENSDALTDVWVLTNFDLVRHGAGIQKAMATRRKEVQKYNIQVLDPPTFARHLREDA